ncbi:UPF0236 family transposase-like protein [Thermosyntropha lipolytica]|uniref:UPF0236 family transposase-like protein n=1 Tax=Thermosyntropha lipolytica TaxID=54294 RepID=UPI00093258D8
MLAFTLDKYHLNKAITQAVGNKPEERREIYSALKNSDQNHFKKITSKILAEAASEVEKKKIKDFKRYVLNNLCQVRYWIAGQPAYIRALMPVLNCEI